jgi:hypothetical protein
MPNSRTERRVEYYRMITFKASEELDKRLIEAAAKQHLSLSDLIRKCCTMALATKDATDM